MDVEKTPAPTCTCPSGDGSLRWPCPIHAAVAAINLHEERIGFVLMPLSPAAVAPHVAEFIMGFDFDEVRDVYGERFAIFWQGLVGKFTAVAPALYITTDLSADFACTLAQHLAARQPGAQLPVASIDPRHLFPMAGKDGTLSGNVLRFGASMQPGDAPLYAALPAQGIDLGQVREIRIPARNKLDPISVFVQDQAAGRGRIVVTCYGNAWQAFWGAMGDRTVMEFVAQCDADYVAGNMLQGRQTRIAKHEREYAARVAAEVIAEFRALAGQGDAAPGVANG